MPALTGACLALTFVWGGAAGIGALWGVLTGSQVFLSYWAFGKVLGGAYGEGVKVFDTLALFVGFGMKAVCIGLGVPLLRSLGDPATTTFSLGLLWVYGLALLWVQMKRSDTE